MPRAYSGFNSAVAGGIFLRLDGANSPTTGTITIGDDVVLGFGNTQAAPNALLAWDTTDANANALYLELPTGGATDVPVLALGLQGTLLGQDKGEFDGVTRPTLAIFDETGTKKGIFEYHTTSPFGGTGGRMELLSDGDFFITPTGSLGGTAAVFFAAADGTNKNLRFVARATNLGGNAVLRWGRGILVPSTCDMTGHLIRLARL